jgi:quaternary ammonium compound-resistance protein SugE
MAVYWFYLGLAGLCEIGWPLGLKIAAYDGLRYWGIALAATSIALSGLLLWLSLQGIPIGTAYAVWTGIGAAGTFLVGVWCFGDPASPMRFAGVALIILGVATLKLAS